MASYHPVRNGCPGRANEYKRRRVCSAQLLKEGNIRNPGGGMERTSESIQTRASHL